MSSSSTNNSPVVNLQSCLLSITDVLNEFYLITTKTSPAPDMISNRFFTECKFVLAIPLLYLLYFFLSKSCFLLIINLVLLP